MKNQPRHWTETIAILLFSLLVIYPLSRAPAGRVLAWAYEAGAPEQPWDLAATAFNNFYAPAEATLGMAPQPIRSLHDRWDDFWLSDVE